MSFKATCGLSNLPINKDDEVVAFLLKEKSINDLRGGQFQNTEDLFIPISAPIYGKYDGFGSIKDINIKYKDLILSQVRSFFSNDINGYNFSIKENTSTININTATLEDIIYEFERGNIVQKANTETLELYKESGEFHRGYYFTGLILFHKDIFEKLVSLKVESELYKESYLLAKKFEMIDFKRELGDFKFNVLMNQVIYESRLPRSECKNFDVYMYWYKNTLDRTVNTELLDFLRQGALITNIMSSLSKTWMPQVISPELETDDDIHKQLNAIINDKLNKTVEEVIEEDIVEEDPISDKDLEIMKAIAMRFNVDLSEELSLTNKDLKVN